MGVISGNGILKSKLTVCLSALALFTATEANAQDFALKTNLLYWGTTTPNLGLEMGLGKKHSAQVFYGLNPWKQSGGNHSSLRHWVVMPEWRYWFCQRFNGWFLGVHGLGGQYNAGGVDLPFGLFSSLKDYRYKGWYIGGGVTAGYQWPLSKHWSFEANIGVGYIYSPNDKHCVNCEGVIRHRSRNYVGPTKAALSFIYVFSGKSNRRQSTVGQYNPQLATLAVTPTETARANQSKPLALMANKSIKVTNADVSQNGGRMTVNITMNLDDLKLGKSNQLVYTPIVHTPDRDYHMPEIIINGRREQILYKRGVFKKKYSPNVLAVGRKNGTPQTITYVASLPVKGKLSNYSVRLQEDVCGCGDVENDNNYPIFNHEHKMLRFVTPEVTGDKIRSLDKRAYIDFPVDRTELHPDYRRNPQQLDSIITTINALKNDTNLTVMAINIHGYASPESPYTHNDFLARNRAKTLTDFVRRMVDLPSSLFTVSSTPEDWDGLRNYISQSNLEHKSEILAIANDESLEPDAREKKIKTTYPDEYRFMLSAWYPALRHSDYHITYKVRPFNVEEAKKLIKTRPQLLSLNEMYMVAKTYEPGSQEFNDVMETAVRMFPDDATANLNAAINRLNEGNAAAAKPFLDKAGNSAAAQEARQVYDDLSAE